MPGISDSSQKKGALVLPKPVEEFSEPRMFKVVFFNDDKTPMDFVVNVLIKVYAHSRFNAERTMLQIHNNGSAVAGTYPFDIAEAKVWETTNLARISGFPLHCAAQPELELN